MHSGPSGGRPGFRYIPDSLGRLNQGRFIPESDLPDPFGRLLAEPEPEPVIMGIRNPLRIRDSVGMEGANDRRDVAKVENLLGRAGALDLNETDGVTGFFGARADEAVKSFQKRQGLKVDGLIAPKGPTLRALAAEAGQGDGDLDFPRPAVPRTTAPDLRRDAIKRAARRLLEMRKAGVDSGAARLSNGGGKR